MGVECLCGSGVLVGMESSFVIKQQLQVISFAACLGRSQAVNLASPT